MDEILKQQVNELIVKLDCKQLDMLERMMTASADENKEMVDMIKAQQIKAHHLETHSHN